MGLNLRDKGVILGLAAFFNLDPGKYVYTQKDSSVHLEVSKFTHIVEIIIPFFEKYISGVKELDFAVFNKVASIMKNKGHLTQDGYNNIMRIKKESLGG